MELLNIILTALITAVGTLFVHNKTIEAKVNKILTEHSEECKKERGEMRKQFNEEMKEMTNKFDALSKQYEQSLIENAKFHRENFIKLSELRKNGL